MKLTKKLQSEILKIYNTYWDAYLAGDMKTFASMLDDNIKVFGTAVSEVFKNKTETVRFYKATADQMTGKAEFRNRKIKMNPVDETMLIHEQCDLFVLIENEWIFYSPVRVSAIFVNTPNGWKLTHQHGSFPDSRAEAGEQIAPEKIKKENLELREAIKRRTVELENKNRELEIEASLEKVRTIAMGMRKPDDMLDVCKTISLQLQSLGVKEIRNVQTAIIYASKSIYINYEYYAKHKKQLITEVDFKSHYYQKLFVNKMLKGIGEIFSKTLKGKKVKEWYDHQKTTNQFADSYLEKAKSLSYYWFSLGPLALGISTYSPLSEEELNLFKRFRNVFELAYQRYLDIEKAETQAREAQIEASLERVRAVAMGMNKSDDLLSICEVSFKEFKKLGFYNIRNSLIHIQYDEQKYFMDYDFSDLTGGAITKIEYGSHPVVEDYLKQIRSAKDAFYQGVIEEDQLEEWKDFRRNSGQINDPRLDKATALYYYFFSIGIGDIGISTLEPINESQIKILKRFRNVFDLAYRRYTDITRAEAQAKEAKIELALERVRARTMAMQKSDELKEVVASMFDGMKSLDVDPTVCNIALVDRKTCDTDVWTAHQTDNGMITYKVFISHFEHPFRKKLLDSFLNEIPFSVHELSGDLKKSYAQYLFEHVDYSNVPAEVTKSNEELANMKDGIVLSAAYMKYGLLIVSRNHAISNDESDILQRFVKIFEQTYTRFLDLQRAEAQAREAKIEAALERVRSRSLAMHHSSELSAVVDTLLREFTNLEFTLTFCIINLIDEQDRSNTVWAANPETGKDPESYYMKFEDYPFHHAMWDAWKEQKKNFIYTIEGEEKKIYDEYLFTKTEFRRFPKHVQEANKALKRYVAGFTFFKYSGLQTVSENHISDEDLNILERFGRVFEQSYTRFLDLQKAEEQTKEAEIQLALERVRAKSLSMHQTSELQEVVNEVAQQLLQMKIDMDGGVIIIINDEVDKDLPLWGAAGAAHYVQKATAPYLDIPIITRMTSAIKKRESFLIERYTKEEKDEFMHHLFRHHPWDKLTVERKQELLSRDGGYCRSMSISRHTSIAIINHHGREFSEVDNKILQRFGNVLEQSYTRFLDLKKAEAQAREAKIEASMEKIRSRSLAMQKPDELVEVAELLRKEMGLLGVEELETSSIYIVDEENQKAECWYAIKDIREENKRLVSDEMTLILSDTWVGNEMWKFYRSKKEQISIVMKGDNRKEWINYCADKSKVLQGYYGDEIPERTYHLVKFNGGYMGAASPGDVSSESWDLLKRATAVFSLAYTRFKDLQDAEASAREAQIEAALERVRSRSAGMQKSEELREVIQVIHDQLIHLNFEIDAAGFTLDYHQNNDWNTWIANKSESLPSLLFIPYIDHPQFNYYKSAKEKGLDFLANTLSFEEKNSIFNYMFEFMGDYPQAEKDELLGKPGLAISQAFLKNISLWIYNLDAIPYSEEDNSVLIRFAKVFEQTYTRFNDLQKAEAQAREAQIEVALERVRSRTMGMQKSEELKEVIKIVYQQLIHLKINLEHAGFVVDYTPKGDWTFWIADERDIPSKITHPYFESVWANQFNEAKEKGADFFATNLNFEEKNKFYNELLSYVPGLPEASKDFYLSCPGLAATTVLFDNVSLYIENFSGTPYSDEENKILMRFGKVFQQTYTRFLDLQKAELQAREAQIEAALERTRTQSMIMQHSAELDDTLRVFHQQVLLLGIHSAFSFLWLPDEEKDKHIFWAAWGEDQNHSTVFKSKAINYPLDRNEPATAQCFVDWKSNEPIVSYHVPPSGVENYFASWQELIDGVEQLKPEYFSGGLYYVEAFMKYGCFGVMVVNDLTEDEKKILGRFAIEFERTYTRFLDLQKAEAQAREAQIEAALERVRSRTMAMQRSDELAETVSVLFKQLLNLGVKSTQLRTCGIVTFNENEPMGEIWITDITGDIISDSFYAPYDEAPAYKTIYSKWKSGEKFLELNLKGDAFLEHLKFVKKYSAVPNINLDEIKKLYTEIFIHVIYFSQGYLFIISYEPLTEYHGIFKRFGSLFHQTYTRFLDFKKVEAQNKIIQAENDRKSKELEDARQLQLSMLPKELPQLPNLDIAVHMKTATEVGGDYYDFNVYANGTLTFVVGDATGHGMMSGMMVSIMKSFFISNKSNIELKQLFENANNSIKDMHLGRLMMSFMGVQITSHKLIATNAGMPSLIYFRNKSQKAGEFVFNNLPLGAMKGTKYLMKEIVYEKGDTLLLMSDGFAELKNKNKEQYGYPRIIEEFRSVAHKNSDAIVEHLKNSASKWMNGIEPDDDVTFVVIKVR